MLPPLRVKHKRPRFDPRLRCKEHLNWVTRTYGCAVRGCTNQFDRIDPAHIDSACGPTIGRKAPDDTVVPLCRTHHREMDSVLGEAAFQAKYGLDLVEMGRDLAKASPALRKMREQEQPVESLQPGP